MEQKEKDLIIALVNGLQAEIDLVHNRIDNLETSKGTSLAMLESRSDTQHERIMMILDILEKNHPKCVGLWEEENCEGGGQAPKGWKEGWKAPAFKNLKGWSEKWLEKRKKKK